VPFGQTEVFQNFNLKRSFVPMTELVNKPRTNLNLFGNLTRA